MILLLDVLSMKPNEDYAQSWRFESLNPKTSLIVTSFLASVSSEHCFAFCLHWVPHPLIQTWQTLLNTRHGCCFTFIFVTVHNGFYFKWPFFMILYPANTGRKKNVFWTVEKPYKPTKNVFKMFFLHLVFAGYTHFCIFWHWGLW